MLWSNNIPNPVWRRLEIEDDSNCETCQRRNREQMELLTEVKCDLLEGATCQECGRTVDIFVRQEPPDEA